MMERLAYLDYSRVFVVFLVIFGHLLPMDNHIPRDFIYSFHMPFFFLVSGMLHKFNGQIQWQKYLKSIGIPLLFFNCLYFFIVNPVFFKLGVYGNGAEITYIECLNKELLQLKRFVLENGNIPSGVTWFLVALLYVKILMDTIKIRPYLIGTIYILTYIVCLLLKFKSCYIINALMVFPFYFLGATFKPYIEKIAFYRGRIFYALLCFLILIGIVYLNGRTSTRGIGFGSAPIPINVMLFYTAGVIGSLMILFISTLFKANKAITFIATSLISILGLQAIFNDPYRILFPTDCYEIMIPTSVVILLLCTGIHWVIMKYAPQLLGKKNK